MNLRRFFSKFAIWYPFTIRHERVLKIFFVQQNKNYTRYNTRKQAPIKQRHFAVLLQVVSVTYDTTYDELVSTINSDGSIHQRHLHFLVSEVFSKNLNPQFMWNYFKMNFFPYFFPFKERKCIAPSSSTIATEYIHS